MQPPSSSATRSPGSVGSRGSPAPGELISPGRMEKERSPAVSSPMRSLIPDAALGSSSTVGLQRQNNCVVSPPRIQICSVDHAVVQSPFELLTKGEEQTIEIPLKTILIKVAESLPAKVKPVFECTKFVGNRGFQAFVKINVSGTKYSVDPHVMLARVPGEICATQELAQVSAVKNAFTYLEKNHFIHVEDYSSKVVDELDDDTVYLKVNSALFLLDKVLAHWSSALDIIRNYCDELQSKETMTRGAGCKDESVVIYTEALRFVQTFLKRYTDKHKAANAEFNKCHAERKKFLEQYDEKTSNSTTKSLRETVKFSQKDVLDYAVSYLGLGIPRYSNEVIEVVDGSMFIGEVKLSLPKIEAARCGGRTKFHGDALLSASSSEEDAAGKALQFMETKLKVIVVDKNYAERVAAKEVHVSHVGLLKTIVELAGTVNTDWYNMLDCVKCCLDSYGGEVSEFSRAPLSNDQIVAVKFCASGMLTVHDTFIQQFRSASVHLKEIQNKNTDA